MYMSNRVDMKTEITSDFFGPLKIVENDFERAEKSEAVSVFMSALMSKVILENLHFHFDLIDIEK